MASDEARRRSFDGTVGPLIRAGRKSFGPSTCQAPAAGVRRFPSPKSFDLGEVQAEFGAKVPSFHSDSQPLPPPPPPLSGIGGGALGGSGQKWPFAPEGSPDRDAVAMTPGPVASPPPPPPPTPMDVRNC